MPLSLLNDGDTYLLHLRPTRTHRQRLPPGKRERDACDGRQAPPVQLSPDVVTVAAVRSKATVTTGTLGGVLSELMLDSGSSISLVRRDVLPKAQHVRRTEATRSVQLVTASGERLPVLEHIQATVQLGELELLHDFVVVESLVAPVILGVDFLHKNGLVLDFTQTPASVRYANNTLNTESVGAVPSVSPLYKAENRTKAKICAI